MYYKFVVDINKYLPNQHLHILTPCPTNMEKYIKISDCGKYGYKSYGEGCGGQLWAWLNTEFAQEVGDVWDEDGFEHAIVEFELEMSMIRAEMMNCV